MASFLASSAIVEELERGDPSSKELVISAGWKEHFLRKNTPSGKEEARIFTRTISIQKKYPEYFARKSIAHVQETSISDNNSPFDNCESKKLDTVSKSAVVYTYDTGQHLDGITSFNDLPSINPMRYNWDSIVIGFDTEFVYVGSGNNQKRFILSYQFAFHEPNDYDKIHEVVFLPASQSRLSFWHMLSWILAEYNLCEAYDYRTARRWSATIKSGKIKKFKSPQEAYEKSVVEEEKAILSNQFAEDGKPFKSENHYDGGYTVESLRLPEE